MFDRGSLDTEKLFPAAAPLDALTLQDAFDRMNAADAAAAQAVARAKQQIVAAIELIVAALRSGGRLFYVGAGTSGRLGVLDAAECPPTFLSDPNMVQGVIAGGPAALSAAVEHCEDDAGASATELARRGLRSTDVVFGIAAGGTTPFVHGAIDAANKCHATSIMLACVPFEQAPDRATLSIRVLTGPEVLAGSTRLKAALATKMVLHTVSTLTMVQLGKVYEGRMVDLNARGCQKLTDRAIRTVMAICTLSRDAAAELLERAGWRVKVAILMNRRGVSVEQALALLDVAGGHLRRALEAGAPSTQPG